MHTLPVPPVDLPALLRAGAAGAVNIEAAVNLLIADGFWLEQPAFRERCVIHDPELAPAIAGIDWLACISLLANRDDEARVAVMLLAIELADYDSSFPLACLLKPLAGTPAARHVLAAVARALEAGGHGDGGGR